MIVLIVILWSRFNTSELNEYCMIQYCMSASLATDNGPVERVFGFPVTMVYLSFSLRKRVPESNPPFSIFFYGFSHGFPIFPWFFYICPIVFPFSHDFFQGFSMFLPFSHGFPSDIPGTRTPYLGWASKSTGGVADPERFGAEDTFTAAVGLEPPAILRHLAPAATEV